MNKDIRKILEENNYVISDEQYVSLFNPQENETISNIKYLGNNNTFQVKLNNDLFEFKVEQRVKIKKRN